MRAKKKETPINYAFPTPARISTNKRNGGPGIQKLRLKLAYFIRHAKNPTCPSARSRLSLDIQSEGPSRIEVTEFPEMRPRNPVFLFCLLPSMVGHNGRIAGILLKQDFIPSENPATRTLYDTWSPKEDKDPDRLPLARTWAPATPLDRIGGFLKARGALCSTMNLIDAYIRAQMKEGDSFNRMTTPIPNRNRDVQPQYSPVSLPCKKRCSQKVTAGTPPSKKTPPRRPLWTGGERDMLSR